MVVWLPETMRMLLFLVVLRSGIEKVGQGLFVVSLPKSKRQQTLRFLQVSSSPSREYAGQMVSCGFAFTR
jgi:hypothetical protein